MTEQSSCGDAAEIIRAMREDGTHANDPVGFHYLEALARRAQDHHGHAGQLLHAKLMAATESFVKTARVQRETELTPRTSTVQRQTGLRGLVESINLQGAGRAQAGHLITHPELKSVQNFRSTWSKLSIGKQVAHAFAQAPKNAGPLNSHVVALRALAQMRDISPDYLHRFLSYVDTLARLDQSAVVPVVSRKPSAKLGPGKRKRVTK